MTLENDLRTLREHWNEQDGVAPHIDRLEADIERLREELDREAKDAIRYADTMEKQRVENERLKGLCHVLADSLAGYKGTTIPGCMRDAEKDLAKLIKQEGVPDP